MSVVNPRRRLAGGVVGTFVEWYDFLIFGMSAPVLAAHFFPKSNPTAAILSTFAVYAIAFFARPLGGVFFGYVGDRGGRIKTLSTTVLLMGAATTVTGLLPTYERIGIAAPVLLVMCRLMQGFSAGGETSGGFSYVIESAPANRRGLWVSIVGCFANLPAALSAVLILALVALLGKPAYTEWAWRIPFLAGGLLSVVGLWLRRRLDDSEEFKEAVRERAAQNPLQSVASSRVRNITIVVLLIAVQAVAGYILAAYMFSFLVQVAKLDSTSALLTNALAITTLAALMPVFGALADRLGRKPLMFAGAAWLFATAYPAFSLAGSGTVAGAIVGQLLIAIGYSLFASGGFVTMLELFPTSMRYTGHAIAYNLGFAIFGGTTPLIAAALVNSSGSQMAPAHYLMAVTVFGLLIIRLTPETRGVALRSSVGIESPERIVLTGSVRN